ncbi:UNVERIFIED_CONTAM: hypothetical protein FKN15_030252 [Acipenser sinensis]
MFRSDLDLDMVKVGDTLDLVVGEDKEADIVTVMRVVFKKVKVGDTLDLVVGEDKEADIVTVMRVVFKKVSGETTDTD